MSLETPQTTSHPVDPSDPVILSKSPDSSSLISPAEYALLLDSQALGESILKRHLTDLNSRPEPPTTEAVTCAILSLRRTTNNRRMLMLMINPDAFRRTPRNSSLTHTHTQGDDPSPHETPRAWRHTKTFYPDSKDLDSDSNHFYQNNVAPAPPPVISSSDLVNPVILSNDSSRPPIVVHANPYLLNPNADDDYDPNDDFDNEGTNDDFDPELNADLKSLDSNFHSSNFSLHTSSDPSDPVDPLNPVILSKNSSTAVHDVHPVHPVHSIHNSHASHISHSESPNPVDPPDPAILSKSSSSRSLFGLSPEDSQTLAAILEPLLNAPRQLRPVPEKYEGMTIEEYNAYCDFNDSGRPMDYLKPEIVAQNKRYTDYIYRDRSLDPKPKPESPNSANPSPNRETMSKSSSSRPP